MRSSIWNPLLGKPRFEHHARINPYHPLNQSMVSWWLMNGGAGPTIYDVCGSTIGTLSSSVTWAYGRLGATLNFSGGTNPNVSISPKIKFSSLDSFFLFGWVNSNDAVSTQVIIGGRKDSPLKYLLLEVDAGVAKAEIYYGSGGAIEVSGSKNVVDGNPHFIGLTRDTAQGKFFLYVDGLFDGSKADTNLSDLDCDQSTVIGNYQNARAFSGLIFSSSVYRRALTAAEVLESYIHPFGTPANPRLLVGRKRAWFVPRNMPIFADYYRRRRAA